MAVINSIGGLRELARRRRTFGSLQSFFPRQGAATLAEWSNAQLDATTNCKDVAWVGSRWPGKLTLEGVLDASMALCGVNDARKAGSQVLVQ